MRGSRALFTQPVTFAPPIVTPPIGVVPPVPCFGLVCRKVSASAMLRLSRM